MHCTTLFISMPGASEILLMSLLFGLPIYFLPAIVAKTRNNASTTGIFVLNLLLGWTFIGWIAALAWAFSTSKQAPTLVVHNSSQSYSQEYRVEPPPYKQPVQPATTNTKLLTQQDKIDHLRQLKQLLDEGILTNEEFKAQKTAVLGL